MSTLQIIRRHRKHPARRPGSKEWCVDVKDLALDRALETVEKDVKSSSADAIHLIKIKKDLTRKQRLRRKVTWIDPEGWKPESAQEGDQPKAA